MKAPLTRIAYIVAVIAVSGYALITLRGPHGFTALMDKERQIKAMEKRNADLSRDVERARERIERLKADPAEQERVIKERLKLVHPNEKVYVLGESQTKEK